MKWWLRVLTGAAVGGAIGVSAVAVDHEVTRVTKASVNSAVTTILEEIRQNINSSLREIEEYENKIKWQFLTSLICALVFCFFTFIFVFDPLAILMAIILKFTAMNLLAETVALLIHKEGVREFFGIYWKYMNDDYTGKRSERRKRAVRQAARELIRKRVTSKSTAERIEGAVNEKIANLPFPESLAYHVFGDSRETLVKEIYEKSSKEIDAMDYDEIGKRICRLTWKILKSFILFGVIAMALRWVVPELAGFGWWTWIILPILFSGCFFWHKQRVKS